jgi:hypothetical protein
VRPFRLARIAAEAEGVRLRGFVTRIVTRAILGVIALLFFMGAVVFVHFAAWYWLRTDMDETFLVATGILGVLDLLIGVVLGFFATRSTPSRVEVDALEIRRKAVQAVGEGLSLSRLAIPLIQIIANLRRRRRAP